MIQISEQQVRELAATSAQADRILRYIFPSAFPVLLKQGDLVKLDGASGTIHGMVACPTVSRLVNQYFGYGGFVIVTRSAKGGSAGTHSFKTAELAVDAGWYKVDSL